MAVAADNPILVEVTRTPAVESIHRGSACIVDRDGTIVEAWGDVSAPVYPRSCVKPLQALAFLETGAADGINVNTESSILNATKSMCRVSWLL